MKIIIFNHKRFLATYIAHIEENSFTRTEPLKTEAQLEQNKGINGQNLLYMNSPLASIKANYHYLKQRYLESLINLY